jgi:hypothetical protein
MAEINSVLISDSAGSVICVGVAIGQLNLQKHVIYFIMMFCHLSV